MNLFDFYFSGLIIVSACHIIIVAFSADKLITLLP